MAKRGRVRVDDIEGRLRRAAGLRPWLGERSRDESRSFMAFVGGASARVQLDHIDGKLAGGVQITLRALTPDAAGAVLDFLRRRNEPNSSLSLRGLAE